MAALQPSVDRVKYVTGNGPYRGSPTTISGNANEVYSYAMRNAHRDPDTGVWTVVPYEDGPSVTTKRHIRAAFVALTPGT